MAKRKKKNIEENSENKVLETLEDLKKKYGAGTFVEKKDHDKIERVIIDFPSIDDVLGGGVPKGRIMELLGKESGCKSTISLIIASAYQRENLFVAYIDTEFSFDYDWAEKMGVDTSPEKFQLIQPETAEQVFEIIKALSDNSNNQIGLIIVDSVSALKTGAENANDFGASNMGGTARAMGQGLRKTTESLAKNNVSLIFINQLRDNLAITFGSKEVSSGGKALLYFASIRCDTRKITSIKKGDDIVGIKIRFKNIKNKTARPFKQREIDFYFEDGFDIVNDYIEYGVECGFIEKGGAWYTIGEERLQGAVKVKDYLINNPDVFDKLKDNVKKYISRTSVKEVDQISSEEEKSIKSNTKLQSLEEVKQQMIEEGKINGN